jgi:hypothetical protein
MHSPGTPLVRAMNYLIKDPLLGLGDKLSGSKDIHQEIREIIYSDGGNDMHQALERAAANQMEGGTATLSRYSVWAGSICGSLKVALDEIEEGRPKEAHELIQRVADSLTAFAQLQALFDERSPEE